MIKAGELTYRTRQNFHVSDGMIWPVTGT
jgi:hypothetical protein